MRGLKILVMLVISISSFCLYIYIRARPSQFLAFATEHDLPGELMIKLRMAFLFLSLFMIMPMGLLIKNKDSTVFVGWTHDHVGEKSVGIVHDTVSGKDYSYSMTACELEIMGRESAGQSAKTFRWMLQNWPEYAGD